MADVMSYLLYIGVNGNSVCVCVCVRVPQRRVKVWLAVRGRVARGQHRHNRTQHEEGSYLKVSNEF